MQYIMYHSASSGRDFHLTAWHCSLFNCQLSNIHQLADTGIILPLVGGNIPMHSDMFFCLCVTCRLVELLIGDDNPVVNDPQLVQPSPQESSISLVNS